MTYKYCPHCGSKLKKKKHKAALDDKNFYYCNCGKIYQIVMQLVEIRPNQLREMVNNYRSN